MAIKISGLDNVIKKLDDLSNIKTDTLVEDAAKKIEEGIKARASFSDEEKNLQTKIDEINAQYEEVNKQILALGKSVFIDIGLKNDEVPFELWKGLWFHNWGYWNKGWNFGENGPYIFMHSLWFEDAVNNVGKSVRSELKSEIKKVISQAIK
mgnify:CR=1 FL=1